MLFGDFRGRMAQLLARKPGVINLNIWPASSRPWLIRIHKYKYIINLYKLEWSQFCWCGFPRPVVKKQSFISTNAPTPAMFAYTTDSFLKEPYKIFYLGWDLASLWQARPRACAQRICITQISNTAGDAWCMLVVIHSALSLCGLYSR